MVEHLWAGWRSAYVQRADERGTDDDRPMVDIADGQTLFEAIEQSDLTEDQTLIVWRGERVFAVLNRYPYTSGHVMVLPNRAVQQLTDLDDDEYAELWSGVRLATEAVQAAYRPHGINVGANLGRGAGAGIPDHLHVHVVPRWDGDTNFMTAVAGVRVMPETLGTTWERLRAVWPTS
ncbi:MAG: HIT domain-containing protein [Actinomycetota bacterium]